MLYPARWKKNDFWSEQSPENRLYLLFRFLGATQYMRNVNDQMGRWHVSGNREPNQMQFSIDDEN